MIVLNICYEKFQTIQIIIKWPCLLDTQDNSYYNFNIIFLISGKSNEQIARAYSS